MKFLLENNSENGSSRRPPRASTHDMGCVLAIYFLFFGGFFFRQPLLLPLLHLQISFACRTHSFQGIYIVAIQKTFVAIISFDCILNNE